MSQKTIRIIAGVCGILGAVILGTSFAINPAPPASYTTPQLMEFAVQHYNNLVFGGWMQGIGSLLVVLFALALVHLARATHSYAGWVTMLAGTMILMVSLLEIGFYLAAAQAAVSGDTTIALTSNALIKAVQHLFLIAPAVLLPLGVVVYHSKLLPRIFAYTALLIGAVLQIGGLLGLFSILQSVIDVVLIIQNVWFIIAAVALIVRPIDAEVVATTGQTRLNERK